MPALPMEADWEVEIGGDAPLIDAAWSGFVDLRTSPLRIDEFSEVAQLPALRDALLRLNASESPVWTAKCDVWQPDEFDPYEMDASAEDAKHPIACYVDLLPRNDEQGRSADTAVLRCGVWKTKLNAIALSNCRADFVVRRACITPDLQGTGITVYLTACGQDGSSAQRTLSTALGAVADAIVPL